MKVVNLSPLFLNSSSTNLIRLLPVLVLMIVTSLPVKGQTPSNNLSFDQETDTYYIQDELIITYYPKQFPTTLAAAKGSVITSDKAVDRLFTQFAVVEMNPLETSDSIFVLRCNGCDVRGLKSNLTKASPKIKHVELNRMHEITSCPGTPPTVNDPYGNSSLLNQISAQCAWDLTTGGNTVIGLVDITGNSLGHNDSDSKILSATTYTSYTGNTHGNNMAGAMAAETNNNFGNPSIGYNTKLRTYNAGTSSGSLSTSASINGINQARIDGVEVINMSFTFSNSGAGKDAVENAVNSGVAVVVSSGNYNTPYSTICDNPKVICVTAVGKNDDFERFDGGINKTPRGSKSVAISAPDEGYWSHGSNNSMQLMFRGTSQSAALTSGTVSLMYDISPFMTPQKAKWMLECSADDISGVSNNASYSHLMGSGRLNAYRAVQQAKIDADFMSGPSAVSSNATYNYSVPSYAGASYRWSVSGSNATLQSGQGTRSVNVGSGSSVSSYAVQCTITVGDCSQTKTKVSSGGGGWLVSAYPNPTSGSNLNIALERNESSTAITEKGSAVQTESELPEVEYMLYDPFGQTVRTTRGKGNASIDVRNLRKGFYTLRVVFDSESITQRIEVR